MHVKNGRTPETGRARFGSAAEPPSLDERIRREKSEKEARQRREAEAVLKFIQRQGRPVRDDQALPRALEFHGVPYLAVKPALCTLVREGKIEARSERGAVYFSLPGNRAAEQKQDPKKAAMSAACPACGMKGGNHFPSCRAGLDMASPEIEEPPARRRWFGW